MGGCQMSIGRHGNTPRWPHCAGASSWQRSAPTLEYGRRKFRKNDLAPIQMTPAILMKSTTQVSLKRLDSWRPRTEHGNSCRGIERRRKWWKLNPIPCRQSLGGIKTKVGRGFGACRATPPCHPRPSTGAGGGSLRIGNEIRFGTESAGEPPPPPPPPLAAAGRLRIRLEETRATGRVCPAIRNPQSAIRNPQSAVLIVRSENPVRADIRSRDTNA